MNLGREITIPQDKMISQNSITWVPTTPEKLILQKPTYSQPERQQNQIGPENWTDLVEMYQGFLQDENILQTQNLSNMLQTQNLSNIQDLAPVQSKALDFDLNDSLGLNYCEQSMHGVVPCDTCDDPFGNFPSVGVNSRNDQNRNIEHGRILNQTVGITSSYMQNSGNVMKVHSLAELMSARHGPLTNRNTYVREAPIIIRDPHCEVGIKQSTQESACAIPQPNRVLPADRFIVNYNLQQMPNSRLSVPCRPSYNLNLSPRSGDGELSSVARSFQLEPVKAHEKEHPKDSQVIPVPHWLIDKMPPQERVQKDDNGVLSQQTEIVERNDDESIQKALETSAAVVSTIPKEMSIPEGGNGGIDLNKTPPQKPPKRRKHRPKVVVEGKSKRTPKPKNSFPEGKPIEKKTCVRGKTSTMAVAEVANQVEVPNTEFARISCRRSLNFNDLETGIQKQSHGGEFEYQAHSYDGIKVPFNMNLNSHGADLNETPASGMEDGHQGKEKQELENIYNFACSIRKNLSQDLNLVQSKAAQPTPPKDHKLNVLARNLNMRNATLKQSEGYHQVRQCVSGGLIQTYINKPNQDSKQHLMIQNKTQFPGPLLDVANGEVSQTGVIQPGSVKLMGPRLGFHGVPNSQNENHSSNFLQNDSESNKKKKIDYKFHGTSSSSASGITTIENCSGPVGITFSTDSLFKFQMNQCAEATFSHLAERQNAISVAELTCLNQEHQSNGEPKLTQGTAVRNSLVDLSKKRPKSSSKKRKSSKKVKRSREDKIVVLSVDYITDRMKYLYIGNSGKEIFREVQNALVPFRGDGVIVPYEAFNTINKRQPRPKVDLDPETNRLWNLLMYKEGSESAETMDTDKQKWWEEERKVFRGRVDSFIARMHLVQGDRRFSKWKGSVVDSVIGVFLTQNVSDHLSSSAFMSLAAKFPPQSTINESCSQARGGSSFGNHVVRITYLDGSCSFDRSTVTSCESLEFNEKNVMRGIQSHLLNNHVRRIDKDLISSKRSSESFMFQASEDLRSSSGSNSEVEDETRHWNNIKKYDSQRMVLLQQNQFQLTGSSFEDKIQVLTNDQIENPAQMQYSSPLTSNLSHHGCSLPMFNSFQPNVSIDLEKWEADILAYSGKESISYLASTQFGINSKGEAHYNAGHSAKSTVMAPQPGRQEFQPLFSNCVIPHMPLQQTNNSPSASGSMNHLLNYGKAGTQQTFYPESTCLTDINQTFLQESTFLTDHNRHAKASNKQKGENYACSEIQTLEPNGMGQGHSSHGVPSKIGSTISNARKRKLEKEKPEPIDWDTLRKQVHSKPATGGVSTDTMDSLDYEALRNADVRVISDTIKERGMNNLLAERMKDFLNRVVRDHGRIDLEWLRDVQPDKAKDYLLSIRGLGLKSVECVRLLTLHHLAFPVDTNVGRIAVRLGWVPLQPLPESLQLHLLELYPVLETIQKYLWPRLCKLDQETLYELHYQMITFGKVFCTKREPNCNACPMRGECRHFASAFASARLSLPGPEEKRIVRSTIPTAANNVGPNLVINTLPLLSDVDSSERESGFRNSCEPIVEEPATPEPPTEISEKDIEDAFYEDPDEIPVIKLDIEEFTTNLQNFMQENMEMQEGDMSRALVALSPEVASIPVPKLKQISRLRTEHQVYELPDLHPLLKGLDRREADDPSPYLLAIWTPGETADSYQPPESKCCLWEGDGLCDNKTCFSCNNTREAQAQTVRGTILIPCRTAMRGSFPLNGTYFQVNEVFADHESSLNPIDVPRYLLWNLPRRTVFFGTSVSSIFKGLSTEDIQYCFWKGFVCVRGFDRETRAPRPLMARLHFPASKMAKQNEKRVS